MEFIENGFNNLKNHLIKNGLEKSRNDFYFINSISDFSTKEDNIDLLLLGILLDREKTSKDKFYIEDSVYKVKKNIFDLYFAIHSNNFNLLSMVFKVLVDFENLENGEKVFLLNVANKLDESPEFVKNFFKLSEKNGSLLLKLSVSVESLVVPPKVKKVTKVEMLTQKLSVVKQEETKGQSSTTVFYVDKEESVKLEKTKIITEISEDYEKKILKRKDKK